MRSHRLRLFRLYRKGGWQCYCRVLHATVHATVHATLEAVPKPPLRLDLPSQRLWHVPPWQYAMSDAPIITSTLFRMVGGGRMRVALVEHHASDRIESNGLLWWRTSSDGTCGPTDDVERTLLGSHHHND